MPSACRIYPVRLTDLLLLLFSMPSACRIYPVRLTDLLLVVFSMPSACRMNAECLSDLSRALNGSIIIMLYAERLSDVCQTLRRQEKWMSFKHSTIRWYRLGVNTVEFSAKLAMESPVGLAMLAAASPARKPARAIGEWGCSTPASELSLGIQINAGISKISTSRGTIIMHVN